MSLLFEDVVDGLPKERTFWEERIVLVEADDEDTANRIAVKVGQDAQHSYEAADGKMIDVTFRTIERVFQIQEAFPSHGTEIFSRILRASEVQSLLTKFAESD